jgi:hypothetical protein
MTQDSIDPSFSEDLDINEFSQNENFFRTPYTLAALEALPKVTFEELGGREGYLTYIKNLTPVFFIDLWDVFKFLKIKSAPGFDPIDIKIIAELVCDFLGNDAEFYEALWNSFDENVAANVTAQLDLDEYSAVMSVPFDNAMQVINSIAELIKRYLVNAGTPIIEGGCLYKVADYKNGIIGLQFRTYEELEEEYGSGDNGDEEEDF